MLQVLTEHEQAAGSDIRFPANHLVSSAQHVMHACHPQTSRIQT
jgi:hypothetical protein